MRPLPPAPPAFVPRLTWRLAALAGVLAVCLLGVLGASPELHENVHADAAAAHHECAVTLFQHGVENPAGATLLAVRPADGVAEALAVAACVAPAPVDRRLAPSCGPPRD
jgi:hypothetical protein